MYPTVSVVVPCYNQGVYLTEALDSVLHQTYYDWECIIVNDGSNDETEKIAHSFCDKDHRFKYMCTNNQEVSAARNTGIDKARGKYILPLDGDDKISQIYIEEAVRILESKSNNVKLVYCKAEFFGIQSGIWNLPKYSFEKLLESNIIFVSAIFKKEDWAYVGGFDGNVNGAEDWEFWISILKNGGEVVCLPFVGFYYRKKEMSKFTSLTAENRLQHRAYIYKKHAAVIHEVFGNPIELSNRVKSLEIEIQNIKVYYNELLNNIVFKFYFMISKYIKKFCRL